MLVQVIFGNLLTKEERGLFDEVSDQDKLIGVQGYLKVLENILTKEGFIDRFVAKADENFQIPLFGDVGGKRKKDYEAENIVSEWRESIKQKFLAEIYGNVIGVIEGAIEYEKGAIENERDQIIQKALEALGGGNAENLMTNKGEFPYPQKLARDAFMAYVKKPTDSNVEARIAKLPQLIRAADAAVAQRKVG